LEQLFNTSVDPFLDVFPTGEENFDGLGVISQVCLQDLPPSSMDSPWILGDYHGQFQPELPLP
jgi:hypothetical protein